MNKKTFFTYTIRVILEEDIKIYQAIATNPERALKKIRTNLEVDKQYKIEIFETDVKDKHLKHFFVNGHIDNPFLINIPVTPEFKELFFSILNEKKNEDKN